MKQLINEGDAEWHGQEAAEVRQSFWLLIENIKYDSPLSNYASIPVNTNLKFTLLNNDLKSRLSTKFSYICCIFSREASTSGYCSRDSKVV